MPFFKDLRRRSRVNLSLKPGSAHASVPKTPAIESANISSGTDSSTSFNNNTVPTSASSSTLSSLYGNSNIHSQLSTPNLPSRPPNGTSGSSTPPKRPTLTPTPPSKSSNSTRHSIAGFSMVSAPSSSRLTLSPYAPHVTSIKDNAFVHQDVLLVSGRIGEPSQKSLDGTITVVPANSNFPSLEWPVYDSQFKFMVCLSPGSNRINLEFASAQLSNRSFLQTHSNVLNINYLPLINSPPLQLVIVLAKDSPGNFDATPEEIQREGNGLDTAIRKFRMAAYLWQAYTAEQMYRNGFGRRCFRFEDEWQTGTLHVRDHETLQMRNQARIHVVRLAITMKEMRDLGTTIQGKEALSERVLDSLKDYFNAFPCQKRYVAAMLLDSHWDPKSKAILGHLSFGGCFGGLDVAMVSSHALHTYPSCLEEVVAAFTDPTPTDTSFVANEESECGSNWEAFSKALQKELHQLGHLFDCPHQWSGIMSENEPARVHRSFIVREAFVTREKMQGLRLCSTEDELDWNRLSTLHLRYHPCLRIPPDGPPSTDPSISIWEVDRGRIVIRAPSGIASIEIFTDGEDVCRAFIEYNKSGSSGASITREVTITEHDLRAELKDEKKKRRMKIRINSVGNRCLVVDDISKLKSSVKLTSGLPSGISKSIPDALPMAYTKGLIAEVGYRGNKIGQEVIGYGHSADEVILDCATKQTKLMVAVKIYHTVAIQGIEFFYEDLSSQTFGCRKDDSVVEEFQFDTRKSEVLTGFAIRATNRIEGLAIITSLGRRSPLYGSPTAGLFYTLLPPRMYTLAGITGTYGQFLNNMGIIITR